MVDIVNPDVLTGGDNGKSVDVIDTAKESFPQTETHKDVKDAKETAKAKQMIEEKIAALSAKKRVKDIIRLRSMISLKTVGINRKGTSQKAGGSKTSAKGGLFDDYYVKITREIWQQWVFPDTGRKDLEAVISIKILRDGTATVQKVEKSSGNALFDRSAIKALAKASPLSPPPYEMEIGVRFYP
jgi:colicin import membrane protein